MSRSTNKTVRLTTSQAIVKYLQVQWSERDGERQRLVPAILGIFGHGNVAGLGQALDEHGQNLPFFEGRNEQSMVHTAAGHARATRRRSTLACAASIGPGSMNMVTGAAAAHVNRLPVLLLPADGYATRHQGPVLQSLEYPLAGDVTLNDCFRPIARFFDRMTRPEHEIDADRYRFAVVIAEFHSDITSRLLDGARECFAKYGATHVTEHWVPGAFELPLAAQLLAETGRYEAVVTLGCVIRGETPHFQYVSGECARGLQQAMLATGVPIAFGVLTTDTRAQAEARAGGDMGNKGWDAALTAIQMAAFAEAVDGTFETS